MACNRTPNYVPSYSYPKGLCNKVAEQHILGKHSNCNSFGVTMALLNSQNFKVAITQLSKVQQV